MKTVFITAILLLGSVGTAFGEERLIENHGFGVFGAEEGTEGPQAVLLLHNGDCVGTYKVANGEVLIGEGKIDFRHESDFDIPFGAHELQVSCIGGNRLRVFVR